MEPRRTTVSTARAVSEDSGVRWTEPGPWQVADGVHRIPLPLPLDGLEAVNVYAVETAEGVVLVDGGWAVDEAREELCRALGVLGHAPGDVRECLVTHVHRDHYTLGAELQRTLGVHLRLGERELEGLELIRGDVAGRHEQFARLFRDAGAPAALLDGWLTAHSSPQSHDTWRLPDAWMSDQEVLAVGARRLRVLHTPGHTPGHVVLWDEGARLMFTGDHVLPTITPSVGLALPSPTDPLGDFLASLERVRTLPDALLLPAHGPVRSSVHARVDELLAHHEDRLRASAATVRGPAVTAHDVADALTWTRRERALGELGTVDQGMALIETRAHLEVLVGRGALLRRTAEGTSRYRRGPGLTPGA